MKEDKKSEEGKTRRTVSASFITGAIALVFLIVGFQAALFLGRVRQKRLAAKELAAMEAVMETDSTQASEGQVAAGSISGVARDGKGDTYNYSDPNKGKSSGSGNSYGGKDVNSSTNGSYNNGKTASRTSNQSRTNSYPNRTNYEPKPKWTVENFRFDPNTATVEELQRLGFTEKQAQSIDNYRLKGGKFRRKTDFAKSFVVADSVYRRLEPYIDIPLIDLNTADSAAFTTLPGIGGYFAAKMVEYREQLGGYSFKEQLMDIYRFDGDKYSGLEDLVCITPSYTKPYPLWTLPEEELALHPYIGTYAAHGIVVFREHNPREDWTVENLDRAGILREGMGEKLGRCVIADNY